MTSLRSAPGLPALLGAEVASSFALATQAMAIPWLVLDNGGSATDVGLVATAELAPAILLGIPLGGMVARVGGRRWMIGSDIVSAGLVAAIAILAEAHVLPFWGLLGLVFAFGSLRTPYMGSQQEVLATLVGERDELLARATSILQGANRTSLLLGPPIAGALVASLGPATTMFLTVATLALVVIVVRLAVPPADHLRGPATRPRLLDGLRELRRDHLIASWVPASALSEAAYQALFVAIPILTMYRYDATAAVAGTLLGAFGGGAVVGSIAAATIATYIPALRLALGGKFMQGLAFVGLILPMPLWGAITMIGALGLANGLTNGPATAVQIPRIAARHRGNALTASATITMSGGAIGSALAGPALDHLPAEILFTIAATLLAASCALYLRGARRASTQPSPNGLEPA